MLENIGALLTYLIAVKDDKTGHIEVKGINSLQCLLKDFPRHIEALKKETGEAKSERFNIKYSIIFFLIRISIIKPIFYIN